MNIVHTTKYIITVVATGISVPELMVLFLGIMMNFMVEKLKKYIMRGKRFYNDNGELHGPFQDYRSDGTPWETSHYVNGVAYGYSEVIRPFKELPSNKFYYCR